MEKMCQGLREWIEDERNEGKAEGRMEGKIEGNAETLIKSVETGMLKFHVDLSEACEGVGTTREEYYKAKDYVQKETEKRME